jgi:ferredoxin
MKTLRILIVTFSQTGSTLKVAEHITEGLKTSGAEITNCRLMDGNIPDIRDYDVIGIGTPVYIFRPPFTVTDYVKSLPDLDGKSFFTFVLCGTFPGACGNQIRDLMTKKHARDLGYLLTRGADYFIGYIKRGYLFSPDSPGQLDLKAAANFGELIAERLKSGVYETEQSDPHTHFIYAVERFTTNRLNTKLLYSRFFSASKKCDACGICVKKCPVQNISLKGKEKPIWRNECILCATCQLVCPKDAISSPFDWRIFSPFMDYNIRKAKRENIPWVKVGHEKGKTIRV